MENKEKVLQLPLKKKWFDMIKNGDKKEEYREIKPHYISRFLHDYIVGGLKTFNSYDILVFTCGYPKKGDKEKTIVFKNPRIRIDKGRSEWGAIEDKFYFVITWEEE